MLHGLGLRAPCWHSKREVLQLAGCQYEFHEATFIGNAVHEFYVRDTQAISERCVSFGPIMHLSGCGACQGGIKTL